jgi:hypothetical protein
LVGDGVGREEEVTRCEGVGREGKERQRKREGEMLQVTAR